MSPANSSAKIIFPLWDKCSPTAAGLLLCRPIHDQKPQNSAGDVSLKIVTDLLALPASSYIILCNCKDREEDYLCFWSLNKLSQGPEVSCAWPWTSYCNFQIASFLKNRLWITIRGTYEGKKISCHIFNLAPGHNRNQGLIMEKKKVTPAGSKKTNWRDWYLEFVIII